VNGGRPNPRQTDAIDYEALVQEDRVHGSLYSHPRVFDHEMARIFEASWVFVGHESEVPEPGDWVTRRIGREPVILVRGRDRDVRVLANRCAHRGTTLCWRERGHSRNFRCTYHAWTFDLDGVLQGVPYPAGFRGAVSQTQLDRPAQVARHRGFVFARMSAEGAPFEEFLGPAGVELLDRLCDLSPVGRIRLHAGWIGHQVESNWKMWYESNNDGYHFRFVHASLLDAMPDTHYEDAVLGAEATNPSRAVDYGGGHSELDFRRGYTAPLAWLGTDEARVGTYRDALARARGDEGAKQLLWDGPPHAMIFPNLFLGEMNLVVIEPVAPGRTILRHTAVGLEGVDAALNRRILRQSEAALGPASFIVPDDATTAERMQCAFEAMAPIPGAGHGWIDLSRGIEREEHDPTTDRRIGHVSDETTNRAFWRHYRSLMAGA